jgi:hypothetical protein
MNGVISCVLAMGIGTTTAYADGNDTSGTAPATADPVAVQTGQTVSENGQALAWTALAPEDLIRAFITLAEKIQIVITVDDAERAKLLDSLTQAKIKEANDLLEAGKTELAANTLNNAIADQSLAIQVTAVITPNTDDKADEADSGDKDEAKSKAAIAEHIRHNIEALTRAMDKVQNPTAKADLEQKIKNSLDKLSQTLDALQATVGQQSQVEVTLTQPAATVKTEDNQDQTKIEAENDQDVADENDDQEEARDKQEEISKAEHVKENADKKEAHAIWKANQNQREKDNQGDDQEDGHDNDE